MKKISFSLLVAYVVAGLSCKEYLFENPVEPGQTIIAPSDLQLSTASETAIVLQWSNKNLPTNYPNARPTTLIERNAEGINFILVDSVAANVTSKSVSGIYLTTTTYVFRVRTKLGANYSASSNMVSATVAFPAPSGLTVTSITATSASLQWTDNSSFETGFVIERSTYGLSFAVVDSVGANITTRSVAGVYTEGSMYLFRVRAKSSYNLSVYSNVSAGSLFVGDVPMITVAGGTFQMGSNDANDYGARPSHSVTLGTFYIDKTEITYEKWTDVRNWGLTHGYTDLSEGQNGYNPVGSNNPVTAINWYDMLKWCNARSEKDALTPVYYTNNTLSTVYRTGQLDLASDAVKWTANGYRLPTEAEWEFAARGGTKSLGYICSGSNNIGDVAWYQSNSGNNTHPVSTKGANELGLYDMSGNVWEWCWDWYGGYPSTGQTDPKGPTSGTFRVVRGGSFGSYVSGWRVAYRNGDYLPSGRHDDYGFRCVQK